MIVILVAVVGFFKMDRQVVPSESTRPRDNELVAPKDALTPNKIEKPKLKACVVSGCSKQICGEESFITTCEFKEEYACYKSALCERQSDGACDWTVTPELRQCLGSF